ncbi:hypothetical protein PR048_000098 [Dryococelus australis]|uniref:Uncharacterized protein n=1 Tax=Dryococelus australis TaxID=614101 RepID=A0ABQ9IDQ0_9NEOP|nr:hypothetical protein PR048_000098 [Dryococelus australis]
MSSVSPYVAGISSTPTSSPGSSVKVGGGGDFGGGMEAARHSRPHEQQQQPQAESCYEQRCAVCGRHLLHANVLSWQIREGRWGRRQGGGTRPPPPRTATAAPDRVLL